MQPKPQGLIKPVVRMPGGQSQIALWFSVALVSKPGPVKSIMDSFALRAPSADVHSSLPKYRFGNRQQF
jgi:hypothetical protein